MKRCCFEVALIAVVLPGLDARADQLGNSLCENAYQSNFFQDTRARRVGDALTKVVREATIFEGKEAPKMSKETKTSANLSLSGMFQAGKYLVTSFSGNFDGQANSQRQLNGKADYES